MTRRYDNILQTIGNTPVVRINKLAPEGINLFVKVESFNPMGSVKDRLALGVIEDAEKRGELKPGQTIVEATSGNTGIGLAMVCAQRGYPLVITMAENFSVERRKMMRFLGARVILTPASEKGTGMVKKAQELAEKHGWWQSRQFENPANADIHERTTAVEILDDFADVGLDYWVTGFGTGGTLNGVSRVLRAKSPHTKVVVCEPDNSRILASGIPQPKDDAGNNAGSHPNFRPHLMQGWSPDFIPKLTESVLEQHNIDEFIAIDGEESLKCARDLAQKEGIFVGITAGATFAGALEVARNAPAGSNILCMLPDTGERYLSTPLFENISADMGDAEQAISQSTPNFRFDVSAAAQPVEVKREDQLDPAALAEVKGILAEDTLPIVVFGLEWCEFCWSVRKLFKKYEIPYRSIELDSVKYQGDNKGQFMREVLTHLTGWNTFPQVFISNQFLGGCTDVFEAFKDGSLAQTLSDLNIHFKVSEGDDPYSFLPGWLHSR